LLGYGCTDTSGNGGNDGILRTGETVITDFSNLDMVSQRPNGAALCFGDSGGPAFVSNRGQHLLLGVNSKGNIKDTNYNTRTDIEPTTTFLRNFAASNGVDICGINKNCGSVTPLAPTCQLTVNPSIVILGQSVAMALTAQGEVTEAKVDNQSVLLSNGSFQRTFTPSSVGSFVAQARVTGPGGSGLCSANYSVKDNTPNPPQPPVDPNPNVPNYTVVPTLCGDNTISETQVRQVCLGIVKFSPMTQDLSLKEVVWVTFRDGAQEVMPLLNKSQKFLTRDSRTAEQWVLYANNASTKNNNFSLDTRFATVTLGSSGSVANLPLSITGRTVKNGQAYNVDNLKKVTARD
jgi:Trypsin